MRLATVHESRKLDELAQSRFALPAELLMEAAGLGAAREIEEVFLPEVRKGRIAVVCGPGNNGADGLVVARHLASGVSTVAREGVELFLVAPIEKRSALFKTQLERCLKQNIPVHDLVEEPSKRRLLAGMNLIVDAIFGIGLKNDVREPYLEVIKSINETSAPIISLDCPSGLDCDRGMALGLAVRATLTVTFGLAKPGFFVSDGPQSVGRLRTLGIGFPQELKREIATSTFAYTESLARRSLPRRPATSNKTRHGHAAVIAGREGMWGAALLAGGAAYRVGAGYVTLASFGDVRGIVREMPELLTASATDDAFWADGKWQVAAVGPGLGTGDDTVKVIERLLQRARSSSGSGSGNESLRGVVLDADAITVVAREKLGPFPKSWILTPHAGELSRLIGVPAAEIEGDRFKFAREAAKSFGCTVLLKGFRTVVATPERSAVILAGNSALAKAGTGDVLTGMIAGLLAQGLKPERAAMTAAYLHGRMADEWIKSGNGRSSLQASDLHARLPELLARVAR